MFAGLCLCQYGVAPHNVFNAHTKLLRTLVPSFGARIAANSAKGRQRVQQVKARPKADPPLCGPQFETLLRQHGSVRSGQLPELQAVVLHMREWEWDDPSTTYKDWWNAFVAKVSLQASQLEWKWC